MIGDVRSGSWILIFPIPDPDPVSRGQKSTGSRIRNTENNYQLPLSPTTVADFD
jgi:hypothetical protein